MVCAATTKKMACQECGILILKRARVEDLAFSAAGVDGRHSSGGREPMHGAGLVWKTTLVIWIQVEGHG